MKQDKSRHAQLNLVRTITQGMRDVKAKDITILDIFELENSVCDYFIITEGVSNTQINIICDTIEKNVRKKLNEKPWHVEGKDNAEWILMDYVSVVAHIFQKHAREFYDLEGLWGDAKVTVVNAD